jgi:hypothetical protein
VNSEFQYVHAAAVSSHCDESAIRCADNSTRWWVVRCSNVMIRQPLVKALAGFRSASPRANWYAKKNPNQIASWRAKSP